MSEMTKKNLFLFAFPSAPILFKDSAKNRVSEENEDKTFIFERECTYLIKKNVNDAKAK